VAPTDTVPRDPDRAATGPGAEREPPVEPEAGIPSDADALMPDLAGKSLRQALALLGALDVDVAVAGRGVVVRQTPTPGTPLAPGASCRLELAPPAAAQPQAATGRRPSEEGRPIRSVRVRLVELG
jgi:hypothetical protein